MKMSWTSRQEFLLRATNIAMGGEGALAVKVVVSMQERPLSTSGVADGGYL